MDLKDLTPKSDTVEVTLVHPATGEIIQNDDDSPMTITLYASHSKEYKNLIYQQTDKRLKKAQFDKKIEINSAEIEESTLDLFANATKSWKITFDGKQPELSPKVAKQIYTEVFWIKDQIDAAIANSANFMKA
jgi:hypothetical protein